MPRKAIVNHMKIDLLQKLLFRSQEAKRMTKQKMENFEIFFFIIKDFRLLM